MDNKINFEKLKQEDCIKFFSYIVTYLTDETTRTIKYEGLKKDLDIKPVFPSYEMQDLKSQEYEINALINDKKYFINFAPCQNRIAISGGETKHVVRSLVKILAEKLFFTDEELQNIIGGKGESVKPKYDEWKAAYENKKTAAVEVATTAQASDGGAEFSLQPLEAELYALYNAPQIISYEEEAPELPESTIEPLPSWPVETPIIIKKIKPEPAPSKEVSSIASDDGLEILENGEMAGSIANFIKHCIKQIKTKKSFASNAEYGGNQIYSADFIKITTDEKNNKFELEFTSAKSKNKKVISCKREDIDSAEIVEVRNKALLGTRAAEISDPRQELINIIKEVASFLEIDERVLPKILTGENCRREVVTRLKPDGLKELS